MVSHNGAAIRACDGRVSYRLFFLVAVLFLLIRTANAQTYSYWSVSASPIGSTSGSASGTGSYTPTGGVPATTITANASSTSTDSSGQASINTVSAKYRITLTWVPKPAPAYDPAPTYAVIHYKRKIHAESSAGATTIYLDQNATPPINHGPSSATGHGDANASCPALGNSPALNLTASSDTSSAQGMPTGSTGSQNKDAEDPNWEPYRVRVTGGKAEFDFEYQLSANANSDYYCFATASHGGLGFGKAVFSVAYYIAQTDMGRHNGLLGSGIEGITQQQTTDPSFTRWLPLEFAPTISNSPFRRVNGNLSDLWGNLNCAYSIRIFREKNPDVNGAGNYYSAPALGSKLSTNTKNTPPNFVILDANGDRLTFTNSLAPLGTDIHSTLTRTASGYTLSGAGPPGNLKARGRYTYTFGNFPGDPDSPNNPEPAVLTSIADIFGNKQTLTYGGGPYLTVTDNSSGRQILFYVSGTMIAQMVAPLSGSTAPAVRTELTWDGTGHLSGIDAFAGNAVLPVRQVRYLYTDTNFPDAPTKVTQDGSVVYNTYVASPAVDSFGKKIPRINTVKLGELADSSSSVSYYPGGTGGSIQGTISYSYGSHSSYFGGVDARTNTITDARNNQTKLTYYYANPANGEDNGAVSGIDTRPQTEFSGVTGPTVIQQRFSPDMTAPTASTLITPGPTTNAGIIVIWNTSYHPVSGNVSQVTDPLQHICSFDWGGIDGNDLLSMTDPTGLTATFTYTPQGKLSTVTDATQAVQAQYGYNSYGQLISVNTPSGPSGGTTYSYDNTTGDLLSTTSPNGATSYVGLLDPITHQLQPGSAYDALGDPLAFTVFPDTGNPVTSTAPLTTQMVWDAAQQVTDAYLPGGQHLVNTYNNGLKTAVQLYSPQGALLSQTNYTYDTRGRLYKTTDLLGTVAQYQFDPGDNPATLIDGKGNRISLSYGSRGELTSVTGADGGSLLYYADGSVRQSADRRNVTTAYTYDNAGRLTQTIASGGGLPAETVSYTYDNANRPLTVTRGSDTVTLAYNHPNKWLTSVTTTVGNRTHTVNYTYRADGRRSSMTSQVGSITRTTLYDYDNAGRLIRITHPNNAFTIWQYDYANRPTDEITTTPASTVFSTHYQYGPSGQVGDPSTAPLYVSQVTQTVNGVTVASYTLTHSYLGQLLTLQGTVNGGTMTRNYAYDMRGRLVGETRSTTINGTVYTGSSGYSFDLADNLNGGANGWVYNSDNRLTSAPAVGGMPGASNLTYDAAGNASRINNQTLTYNVNGQLTKVSPYSQTYGYPPPPPPSGPTINISYDPLGRRFSETVTDSNGNVTSSRYFDYDGNTLIAEQLGGTISDGSYTSYLGTPNGYVGATGGSYGQDQYYGYGPDGEMWGLASQTGSSLWNLRNGYDVYGNPLDGPAYSAPPSPFRQQGVYTDPATGWAAPADNGLNGAYSPAVGDDLTDGLEGAPSYGSFLGAAGKRGWGNLTKLPSWQPGSPERNFESSLFQMLPGIGQLYQAFTVATGKDPIAGKSLTKGERVFSGVMLGIGAVAHLSPGGGSGGSAGKIWPKNAFEPANASDPELLNIVNSIFEAGGYAPNQQTVAGMRTVDGPILIAANMRSPLNAAQLDVFHLIQDNLDATGSGASLRYLLNEACAIDAHAEEVLIAGANRMRLQLKGGIVAASNCICGSCADILIKAGILRASRTNWANRK